MLKLNKISVSDWTRVLTVVSYMAAMAQVTYADNIPLKLAFIAIAGIATVWKQQISVEISQKAIIFTVIVSLAFIVGGIGDYYNLLPLDAAAKTNATNIVAIISGLLSIISKTFFPTYEAKLIENQKAKLKENE